jgi:chorismate mutase/prephenate dehydrogenase
MDELERLRLEIRDIDARIVELAAKRTFLARTIGDIKAEQGAPIRNYAVEAEVIRLARERAARDGFPADVAEEMLKLLIRESLRAQERDRIRRTRAASASNGQRALVVGGAGNMGRWFAEFLDSKGFGVAVADPRGAPPGFADVKDVAESAAAFDVVLVATPPSAVAGVLKELRDARGLVFEIGSLKSPFLAELRAFARASPRAAVTSVHPMWGPKTDLLASKNVVVCDVGDPEANRAARALFEDTAANLLEMPIEEHDRHMARVLGLPHAINLVFGHAMEENGYTLASLAHLGGPTFQKQLAVTREVASENKDLYYEIQRLNPHTPEMLALLRRSLDEFEQAVAARDAFRAYMSDAETFFGGPS